MATPVQAVFETHLTVQNLDRSVAFYRDVLGLTLLRRMDDRRFAFFWVGEPGTSMLGLWETGTGPIRQRLHFAFRTDLQSLLAAPAMLREKGVIALDFDERPTEEPIVFPWMPAASIYFQDPDGHSLEYLAMIHGATPIEGRVMSWTEWREKSANTL